MSVLLDTGVLYAFLNPDDPRADEAAALMGRIGRKEFGAPFVTDHVIDELFTLIRARTGSAKLEEAAKRFLPMPAPSLHGLAVVALGESLLGRAWEEFARYRDQRISFTDAGLIAAMRELRIDTIATFDEALRTLVPTAS